MRSARASSPTRRRRWPSTASTRRRRRRSSPPTATRSWPAARIPISSSWPTCVFAWPVARGPSSISEIVRRRRVIYAKAFFDLQLRCAHKVTTLSGLPLSRVLLEYTNLYIRFGLGRDFNPAHPTWQAYLAGLKGPACIDEWTHDLYLTRHGSRSGPTVVATVGCFSYAPLSGERIRLHFHDADLDGQSPLAIERARRRRAELTGLFQ